MSWRREGEETARAGSTHGLVGAYVFGGRRSCRCFRGQTGNLTRKPKYVFEFGSWLPPAVSVMLLFVQQTSRNRCLVVEKAHI